jgi:hypothetical protein
MMSHKKMQLELISLNLRIQVHTYHAKQKDKFKNF